MFPIHDENPIRIIPFITVCIIIACIGIFVWQITHDAQTQYRIVYSLGMTPAILLGNAPAPDTIYPIPEHATILTSMFLHGGWMHLISNMLYLWIFGNNIEEAMGHTKFILFYLLCGIAAVFAQALPEPASTIPMIGASGAISGILGAYLLLHPQVRITILIPILLFKTIKIKAMWVLLIWIGLQIIQYIINMDNEAGGVAFAAHIGGFVAGMLLCPLFKNKDTAIKLFKT